MFGRASSYLWGSSSAESPKKKKSPSKHAPSHSLTDLDDIGALDGFDQKLQIKDKRPTHQIVSSASALSNIAFRLYLPPQFDEPPTDVVLDKDSALKLSATTSIAFLFPPIHNRNRPKLCGYPFFIESNRNAVFCSKMDLIRKSKKCDDGGGSSPQQQGGVPLDATDCEEAKEAVTEDHDALSLGAQRTSLSSSILSIVNVDDLNRYLDSLCLTKEEKHGILTLCEWVKTEKLSIRQCEEMWMAEIVITYFSSLSPTNPDLYGCWRKWINFRIDHLDDGLYNVNPLRLRAFFETGIFSVGFDKQRRPVWFLNTEPYDDSFGVEVITKACILWVASLQWDLKKNEFDLFALRRGLSIYVNLSHWSINMASWGVINAVKRAMVAFPFHLVSIFVSNIPTFMYLIKQLAAKVVVPHAMEKVQILGDHLDYFEHGHADKHETPCCAGGTLRVSAVQWMRDRGFLDYVDSSVAEDAIKKKQMLQRKLSE